MGISGDAGGFLFRVGRGLLKSVIVLIGAMTR